MEGRMKEKPLVWWVAERKSRCVKTILVQARSKREAQEKLDNDEGEGTDVSYYDIGRARPIRRDRSSSNSGNSGIA